MVLKCSNHVAKKLFNTGIVLGIGPDLYPELSLKQGGHLALVLRMVDLHLNGQYCHEEKTMQIVSGTAGATTILPRRTSKPTDSGHKITLSEKRSNPQIERKWFVLVRKIKPVLSVYKNIKWQIPHSLTLKRIYLMIQYNHHRLKR